MGVVLGMPGGRFLPCLGKGNQERGSFMAVILPFCCVRPNDKAAHRVAALPYDVYSRKEAKEAAAKDPLSFLNIDRPETQFADDVDMYADNVYQKARELLDLRILDGTFLEDKQECYYLYELIMNGRSQTGIVACASMDDYLDHVIKKHENTREEKEQDRIRHVDVCSAQTGPIFLAYRSKQALSEVVREVKKEEKLYGFVTDDGIIHNVWRISDKEKKEVIQKEFAATDSIYIADGHHRAASAVKVGLKRRAMQPDYDKTEPFNYFLCVLFPQEELMILPYNRVVKDLNGLSEEEFLARIEEDFTVEKLGNKEYQPQQKGCFGMFLKGCWYCLKVKSDGMLEKDPVKQLDVSILYDKLLAPVLGIKDPRTDGRIDFIGGIRGLKELARRASSDMEVAFSLYPTAIEELFAVSDAGCLMPPKSTWFEPKLRSGLFIHKI